MESTVGGKDAAIGPQGWVYGVLTKGNAPAFSFNERQGAQWRPVEEESG